MVSRVQGTAGDWGNRRGRGLMTNRLAGATSPYLLQHPDNPVDWWEWGTEAFAEARERNVPVLLSVGYAACHWCHVMAHESFEDEATAAYLNEHFVSVKVDREERPDVDAVYMQATVAMTGQGGWPMTCLLDHEGEPVLRRHLLPRPAAARAAELPAGAGGDPRGVDQPRATRSRSRRRGSARRSRARSRWPAAQAFDREALGAAVARAGQRTSTPTRGGFGGAPKFPPSMVLEFLLRHGSASRRTAMAGRTLEAMARGGHLRPARRRVRPLRRRPRLGGAALREDALRQRPAARRLRALGGGPRRRAGAPGGARDGRLPARASWAPTRAPSPRRWTPTARAPRARSTSGPRPSWSTCSAPTTAPGRRRCSR